MKNNDINQGVTETPMYIVIRVEWDCKLIMPIEDGLHFMKTWATATEIKEKSGEPTALKSPEKSFEVKFISDEQFKQMKMAAVIGAI